MKNIWNIFNKNWYNPVLILSLICLICFFTLMIPNQYIFYASEYIPLFIIVLSITTSIIRIFRRKFFEGVCQFLLTCGIGSIWFYGVSLFILYGANDFYADNLKIPDDFGCEQPRRNPFINDKITPGSKEHRDKADFELSYSYQPGIYFYEAWVSNLEPGELFFRCYEVTKNDQLSYETVETESRIEVIENHVEVRYYRLFTDFMIIEGDWGKPYCARFELWYRNGETKNERILLSKNLIIEGWQR